MGLIENGAPKDWQDLQASVGRILTECGMTAAIEQEVTTVRGPVVVDVVATDAGSRHPQQIFCECKHWKTAVPKYVVHAFRTVVTDAGANLGLIISSRGFQTGAHQAAEHSHIRLLTWEELQQLYAPLWVRRHMGSTLGSAVDPLVEYTERINSRIARRAATIGPQQAQQFATLRARYAAAAFGG